MCFIGYICMSHFDVQAVSTPMKYWVLEMEVVKINEKYLRITTPFVKNNRVRAECAHTSLIKTVCIDLIINDSYLPLSIINNPIQSIIQNVHEDDSLSSVYTLSFTTFLGFPISLSLHLTSVSLDPHPQHPLSPYQWPVPPLPSFSPLSSSTSTPLTLSPPPGSWNGQQGSLLRHEPAGPG